MEGCFFQNAKKVTAWGFIRENPQVRFPALHQGSAQSPCGAWRVTLQGTGPSLGPYQAPRTRATPRPPPPRIPTATLRPIQPLPGPRRTGLEAICVGSDCNLGPCGPQSIVAFAQRQAEIARRAAQEMSSGPGRGQRWAPASPSRRPAATARRGYFFI